MKRLSLFFLLVTGCLAPLVPTEATARNPVVTKLHPRPGDVTEEDYGFGKAVAVNENWIVVGARDAGPTGGVATEDGSVYVFSARSGRLVRRIRPSRQLFNGAELSGSAFGASVALCGDQLLVGMPFFEFSNPDGFFYSGTFQNGAALLYDLPTGRLRQFVHLENTAEKLEFGKAVALSERWIVVGETHDDLEGRAHVFDARTGEFQFSIQASDGFPDSEFGFSLALCGDILAVGAYDSGVSTTGAVYVFDLEEEGTELGKLTPSDGSEGDWFGRQLAVDGGRLLVGAEYHDQEDGAAYLFDLGTGNLIRKLTAPNPVGGEHFGAALALSGNLALIQGYRTYLVDVRTGDVIRELSVADNRTSFFPDSVSLCGNLAVIGEMQDDDVNTDAGAAYFFRPLAGPLPLETITQVGNSFSPAVPDAEYRRILAPSLSPDGTVAFSGILSGPGSGGGRNQVISSNHFGSLSGFYQSGGIIARFTPPILNRSSSFLIEVFYKGPGFNRFNRQVIGNDEFEVVPGTGIPIAELSDGNGTPEVLDFLEVVQKPSATVNPLGGVAYRLRNGVGGTTPRSDSGVLLFGEDGTPVDSEAREGKVAIFGESYAQFFGRLAQGYGNWYAYSAYVVPNGGGRPLQQCFTNHEGNSSFLSNVAKQGDDAPLATGPPFEEEVKFRSILGEGLRVDFGLVRARIVRSNPGNRFRNEGIWREGQSRAYLIKGEEFDRPGTFVQRILRFWPVGNNNVVVLVKLTGPAVNPGNDCALAITEDAGGGFNLQKLVREGDAVCDWDCPRIRTIQRVDVDPENGNYAVVVALTGSPRRNQALLTGNANLAHPNNPSLQFGDFTALRRPNPALRKGTLYNTRYAEATRLRSILLEPRIDRTGSGGKGLGQVINASGEVVLCLQFDDGAKELVVGKP